MQSRLLSLLFLLALLPAALSAQTKNVLFLGNSYTYVNDLPGTIREIAETFGDSLNYNSNCPGGYTLEGHSTNTTSLSLIASQPWDYVVLQEQSQRPSFSPAQVAAEVYPYADSLHRKIKENDSCTTVLFYMTWGRKNGDASNCPFYPPVCTYQGMQARLRESYLQMGEWFGEVAPVGATWKMVRDSNPDIELYNPDESHPSLEGTYLAGCVFYASIWHKSPVGAWIPAGLDSAKAEVLQMRAAHVVLDSLPTWFIDTHAVASAFTAADLGGGVVSFTNASTHATSYWWDFGDGGTSGASNPSHTYTTSGTYPVTLISYRGCLSDTLWDSVTVVITGSDAQSLTNGWEVFPNPAHDCVNLRNAQSTQSTEVRLVDLHGRVVRRAMVTREGRLDLGGLSRGLYLLEVEGEWMRLEVE
jgi:hypothetical protein